MSVTDVFLCSESWFDAHSAFFGGSCPVREAIGSPVTWLSENHLLSKQTRRAAILIKRIRMVWYVSWSFSPAPSASWKISFNFRKNSLFLPSLAACLNARHGRPINGGRIQDDISRTSCHLSWFSHSNTHCRSCACWLWGQACWRNFNEKYFCMEGSPSAGCVLRPDTSRGALLGREDQALKLGHSQW